MPPLTAQPPQSNLPFTAISYTANLAQRNGSPVGCRRSVDSVVFDGCRSQSQQGGCALPTLEGSRRHDGRRHDATRWNDGRSRSLPSSRRPDQPDGLVRPVCSDLVPTMSYHFSKKLDLPFDQALARVTEALKREGFGILTDINVKTTLKSKLNENFREYRILGACNPPLAFRALQLEDKIGTMLPCNVIVQENQSGGVEVSAVDPVPPCRQSRTLDLPMWRRRCKPSSRGLSRSL